MENGEVKLFKVDTAVNPADILTKPSRHAYQTTAKGEIRVMFKAGGFVQAIMCDSVI